jgi:hypothetical protein
MRTDRTQATSDDDPSSATFMDGQTTIPYLPPHWTVGYADWVRWEAAMTVRPTLSFRLGRFVVAAFFAAPHASAQANAAPEPLKFEVASVKVATSGSTAFGEVVGESILCTAMRNRRAAESHRWAAV